MRKVAVIGASGYVGSAVCVKLSQMPEFSLTRVTRADYEKYRPDSYDILINAAMPAKRFWAKNNPDLDFLETVQKTKNLLADWKFGKFIHISSVSARCELDSVYGRHKAEAEALIGRRPHLIVRLTAMYSPDLEKGALIDILQDRPVYVSGQSRYAFTPLDFVASWIAGHLDDSGLVEVGARNTISLEEIAKAMEKEIPFSGPVECQEIQNPAPDFPDAYKVIEFMKLQKKNFLKSRQN